MTGRSRLSSWARLLRVPNLFTVPGDPIVGFVIAGLLIPDDPTVAWGHAVGAAALVSLLLYAAGLLANDYFDLAEDRRDRPARPLPAGEVSPRTAIGAALALIAAAVGLAATVNRPMALVAGALGACVLAYDALLKRVPVVGPLAMGACRGLSLMVGAAARHPATLTEPLILAPAAALTLYIASVTLIAVGETRRRSLRLLRWGPPLSMVLLLVAILLPTDGALLFMYPFGYEPLGIAVCVLFILAAGGALSASEALRGSPEPPVVQRTIGRLIRNLLLVHAAVAVAQEFPWCLIGVACLVGWPVSAMLARRFYAS